MKGCARLLHFAAPLRCRYNDSTMVMLRLVLVLVLLPCASFAQASYKVYRDHPRLFLNADHLRRLQRDVKRESDRWITLQRLIEDRAVFSEEPLLRALLYKVAGDEDAARQAIGWALAAAQSEFRNPADLRLGAIVFDWCYPLLDDTERTTLAAALGEAAEKIVAQSAPGMQDVRSALLAALAATDDWPRPEAVLESIVARHWDPRLLSAVKDGSVLDHSADLVALLEIMHASRHNLEMDLWQQARDFFLPLPIVLMLGSYPQPLQTPEGLFQRAARPAAAKADAAAEATSLRIAQMLLVDYENGLENYQFLQGWLRHDLFTLNTPYGAVYEFIWLNPYLPGLSYFSAPTVVHDKTRGWLFARQGWQDEDLWIGYLDDEFQLFADGQLHIIKREDRQAPLVFPQAAVVLGRAPMDFRVEVIPEGRAIYVLGLGENQPYSVRINKDPSHLVTAGRGGILTLENRPELSSFRIDFDAPVRVSIRPAPQGRPSLRK
jgi:hypothetical protein